jgi:uncharacterized protein (DUF433 family)
MPMATVVDVVTDGVTVVGILGAYPDLERKDASEAMCYAAEAVRERQLPLLIPA